MITFNRIASVQAGKMGGAMGFAQEIAAYVKDSYGVKLDIAIPVGGNPNRIGWSAKYADLAAMEAVNDKMLKDVKYQQLVSKAADFIISGATRDSIWRHL